MRYVIEKKFNIYQGIKFTVNAADIPKTYIEDQVRALRMALDAGVEFSEGNGDLRIGWSLMKLASTDEGYLEIYEPDFIHFPVQWVSSLDTTFHHFDRQIKMNRRMHLLESLTLPTISEGCLVCSKYSEGTCFVMERFPSDDQMNSGWYIGCDRSDHDHDSSLNLRMISLYEAYLARPSIVDYMGLPHGIRLLVSAQEIKSAEYCGQPVKIDKDHS